jgi:hypothetical protein
MKKYFKDHYKITLRDDQALLKVKPSGSRTYSNDVLLPMELCFMTGIPEESRKDIQTKMRNETLPPNAKRLIDEQVFSTFERAKEKEEFASLGISVRSGMKSVRARRCTDQVLIWGKGSKTQITEQKCMLWIYGFSIFFFLLV